MRGPERIVDEDIGVRRQRLRELRVVLFFLGMKPKVLEEDDARFRPLRLVDGAAHVLADAVVDERHRTIQQATQPIGDRPETHLRVAFALGPSQMTREHDRRAVVQRVADCRQRRADPCIVADSLVLDRDVEVDADERTRSRQLEISDRQLGHQPGTATTRLSGGEDTPASGASEITKDTALMMA